MAQVYANIGDIIGNPSTFYFTWEPILMLLLLGCSAFFSGAETAFFNLSHRQIKLLAKSEHRLQKLSWRLLNKPGKLLSCLLFGNMTVNVLFYAVASVLTVRVKQQMGVTSAAITACLALGVLVVFGEILPKTLAYANSRAISTAAALPVFSFLQISAPIVFLFRFLIVEPAIRLLLGPVKAAKAITTGEFKSLIEQVRKRGLITADENKLLTEVIELGFLKVRDCLRPRVDMTACAITDSSEKACELMLKNRLTKLPVYAGSIDNIVGMVHLRQLLLEADAALDSLVRRVNFVPEQKTVESLLEFFRQSGTDTAIVVDEYGGIAGLVRLEDIAEELLGPIEVAEGIEPIEQIGPLEYRLAGNLSIHDWSGIFGIEPGQTQLSTIGGLVTALLGKIPRAGDVVRLKNLKFTVEQVRKRRIETLILTLEPIPTNGQ